MQYVTDDPDHPKQLNGQAALAGGAVLRAVTLRSVLLGLAGVGFICGLTPYNDYVMGSTYLVGNFLPIGLLFFVLCLVLFVNAGLYRFWPSRAIRSGELAVVLGMTLVSCTLPSSGLMRYLPSAMVGVYNRAGIDGDAATVLRTLNLPDWMFPTFESKDVARRGNEPVVRDYLVKTEVEGTSFRAHFMAVPWALWIKPAITWGFLIIAVYGGVLCMSVLVRQQWVENERLAFPIASVYLSIIEPPKPGNAFNSLFRSKGFWIAFGLVFFLHGANALYKYLPNYIPEIPIKYDLQQVMSEGNWQYFEGAIKTQQIYFSVIGLVFFLQTRLTFSLWSLFILGQTVKMGYKLYGTELVYPSQLDQMFGALIAYGGLIVWIGRHHWLVILKQMFRGPVGREARGRYLPYSAAGWGFAGCCSAMVIWLLAAGASLIGAVVLVATLMLFFIVMARVVAETGLLFVQIAVPMTRPWVYAHDLIIDTENLAKDWYIQSAYVQSVGRSFFWSSWFNNLFTNDLREAVSPYTIHAMRVADDAAYSGRSPSPNPRRFFAALATALLFGYLVAGASTLFVEYNYASTRGTSPNPQTPINKWGVDDAPKSVIMDATRDYLPPRNGPAEGHWRMGHFSAGVLITSFLSFMQLRFASWPLHPIGYLLMFTWPVYHTWFSIFIGWLMKTLIVRFGGATGFRTGKPFFIGLVVGEAGAAATWLIVSLIRDTMGLSFYNVTLLPG